MLENPTPAQATMDKLIQNGYPLSVPLTLMVNGSLIHAVVISSNDFAAKTKDALAASVRQSKPLLAAEFDETKAAMPLNDCVYVIAKKMIQSNGTTVLEMHDALLRLTKASIAGVMIGFIHFGS